MSETYVTYRVWDGCKAPINLEYSGRLIGQIVRESTIDSDALLTVTQEMNHDAFLYIGAARSFTECGNHDAAEICYEVAGEYNDYAKIIREVLGVTS